MADHLPAPDGTTRRQFLASSLWGSTVFVLGCSGGDPAQAASRPLPAPYGGGKFVKVLPFKTRRRRNNPEQVEVVYGEGRQGRFRQDLTRLSEETLITSNERFYIRSRCPDLIDFTKPWEIRVDGLVDEPRAIALPDIESRVTDLGVHLMECSGNGGTFGLLSAANWTGVPLLQLLDDLGVVGNSSRILVSGYDDHSTDEDWMGSQLGASWVYTVEQLAERGAFLATHMNGEKLPEDHGYPVRLVIPGWYGCTCIKWVNEIRFVDETEPATAQMQEYASRTHQETVHELAVDYAPAEIDLCAMPTRIEHWEVNGEPIYRVIGVIWGGKQLTDKLQIQFAEEGEFVDLQDYKHETNRTWDLWSHMWKPEAPGEYQILLRVDDDSIRTRRLDNGHYRRRIDIEAV